MHIVTRRPRLAMLLFGLACALPYPAPGSAQTRDSELRTEYRDSLTALPEPRSLNARGTVYVPVYSRVRDTANKAPVDVTATLRIDNASDSKPIVIGRIDYFSTSGKLLQRYLDTPIALRPLGAVQISIQADDRRGGAAANFIVSWAGSGPIAEPVIEAVMVGTTGNSSYSFVSQGRAIKTIGKSRWFDFKTN